MRKCSCFVLGFGRVGSFLYTLLPGNKGRDLGVKKKMLPVLLLLKLLLAPDFLAAAAEVAASFRVGVIKQGKVLLLSLSVDGIRTGSCSLMLSLDQILKSSTSLSHLQPSA